MLVILEDGDSGNARDEHGDAAQDDLDLSQSQQAVDLDGASPDDHDGPGQQVVDLVGSSQEDPGDQARQDDADHDEPKVPEVLFQHYIACV